MLQVNGRKHRSWIVILALMLMLVATACGAATAPVAEAPVTESAPVEEAVAQEADAEAAIETEDAATPVAEEEAAAGAPSQPAAESATADGSTGSSTFVIDPAQSEVRFTLTELLMGNPTTVIGTGNGIEGSVTVNFDDYSQSAISQIVIDATTLATDNNMRNGQIRRAILQTNNPDYQFITFAPTAVDGLPQSVTVGEAFDIAVTGDLTIRTMTQPMTFDVTVTPVSETEIRGRASTTLLRADFDLQIPSVPSVANVSEEVLLEFDFVALAQ